MSQYGPTDPQQPGPSGQPGGQPDPYGAPPPNPYGQPPQSENPYGAPPTQPYGAPGTPYPGSPEGGYGYGGATAGMPAGGYASWIKRVGAYLVDQLVTLIACIPGYILLFVGIRIGTKDLHTYTDAEGYTHTTGSWNGGGTVFVVLGGLLLLGAVVFAFWNIAVRQGRTGYSIGKSTLGIKLIRESDGQPMGAGMSFLRQLVHVLDSFCYIGYLWPLWDAKSQTFADKIMSTVVVNQPKA